MCFYGAAFLIGVGLGLVWLNFGATYFPADHPAQILPSNTPPHVLRGPVPV
jgi:hypothetical protein